VVAETNHEQGGPLPDQCTTPAASTSTPVTPECDCYVHKFGSIAPGRRMRRYPSDMTDAEWAEVRAAMPVPAWLLKRGGRPESYCHREMLDAVRYLVDNGAKWMAVPVDFPFWRAVYDFFRRWREYDYVRELYERLRRSARERRGRRAEPTAGIIDSQSVDASETVGEDTRGFDGGKSRDGRRSSRFPHPIRHSTRNGWRQVKLYFMCGLPTETDERHLDSSTASDVSMPGIGVGTGARILIDVGDGSNFPTAAHLAAYAGLAPATRSSGSSIRGEQPSRRGNK
jgi:transposase